MQTLTVTQWGNSQAIRLDKTLLAQAGIGNGSRLQVEVKADGTIVMKPLKKIIRASDIDELFKGYNGSYRGEELSTGMVGSELI